MNPFVVVTYLFSVTFRSAKIILFALRRLIICIIPRHFMARRAHKIYFHRALYSVAIGNSHASTTFPFITTRINTGPNICVYNTVLMYPYYASPVLPRERFCLRHFSPNMCVQFRGRILRAIVLRNEFTYTECTIVRKVCRFITITEVSRVHRLLFR